MKPSLPLYYATGRHTSLLLPRPQLRFANQLRRATVVHNDVLPLIPHQVRNLQQAPPPPPTPQPDLPKPPPSQPQPQESIVDKYHDKLRRKAEEEGIGEDIDALKGLYKDKIDAVRKQDAVVLTSPAKSPASSSPPTEEGSSGSASPATSASSASSRQAVRTLSSILDLEKIRALPNAELSKIWRLRHAKSTTSLCATIPAHTYHTMETLARHTSPQFILPVPHDSEGAELHFLQWTFGSGDGSQTGAPMTTSTVLFTSLAEYKLKGEFALPHTTVTHHLDLVGERKLVLMEGSVVEGRGTTVEQARWLVMCLQRFYGALSDGEVGGEGEGEPDAVAQGRRNRRQLVEWFGKGDSRFNINMLMEEAQRVG